MQPDRGAEVPGSTHATRRIDIPPDHIELDPLWWGGGETTPLGAFRRLGTTTLGSDHPGSTSPHRHVEWLEDLPRQPRAARPAPTNTPVRPAGSADLRPSRCRTRRHRTGPGHRRVPNVYQRLHTRREYNSSVFRKRRTDALVRDPIDRCLGSGTHVGVGWSGAETGIGPHRFVMSITSLYVTAVEDVRLWGSCDWRDRKLGLTCPIGASTAMQHTGGRSNTL